MDLPNLPPWLPPLGFWKGALAAFALAFAVGAGGRPRVAALAAAIGLLGGFALMLGGVPLPARGLVERLPILAVIGLVAAVLAGMAAAPLRIGGLVLGVLAGAWWMAGEPAGEAALREALLPLVGIAVAMAAAAWRGAPAAAPMVVAWLALALGLRLSGAPVALEGLALAGFGAAVGAALAGMGQGMAAALPLGMGLAGLAAVPVLASTGEARLAAVAGPALALLAGPFIGQRLPGALGAWAGPAIAAAPALALAAWMH